MHWERELLLVRQAYWSKRIGKGNNTFSIGGSFLMSLDTFVTEDSEMLAKIHRD
jgi:hypothetical protein